MAGQHLDAILRGHEAFNRGDLTPAKVTVTEDVEWGTTGTWPGLSGTFHGPDALDAWMETIRAEWVEFEVTLVEVLREQDRAVAVAERLRGKGRESGIEVEMNLYSAYLFDDQGRIRRRISHTTPEQALAELGTSEQ
jgi:ketosteroid isomerase-like protein